MNMTRRRRPNVVIWLVDDVGFGHLSPYGGRVEMPALQRLADRGVQFTNAHVTPLCAPPRACLLTGRNHHTNHMGSLPRWTAGVGEQDARIPRENGFLSEIVVRQGYATYCIGKWHLTTVDAHKASAPRSAWPLGRGFERFYGFMDGQTSSWNPHLVLDNGPVYPPKGLASGYHPAECFEPHHMPPFAFNGRIVRVIVRTDGANPVPPEVQEQVYLQ